MSVGEFFGLAFFVLFLLGANMTIIGHYLSSVNSVSDKVVNGLISIGGGILIVCLNIVLIVLVYIAIVEVPHGMSTEDNCRMMFNIY